ncbi:MAG: hypothetical protein ACK56I_10895, partial [bacterium]
MKPRLRLIGLTAAATPLTASNLESKFDEESKEEVVAASAKASLPKPVDVTAVSVAAMLSTLLHTNPTEAELFLLSL